MKSCIKSVIVILLIMTFSDLHAQVKPGYIFGLNLSTMTLKTKDATYDPRISAGIYYGGYLDVSLTHNFSLRPNLLFSTKGSKYKTDSTEFSISPVYAELSIYASYSVGSEIVKFCVFTGPYIACGISGYKIDPKGDLRDISYGSNEYSDLRPFDFGFCFGAGIIIKEVQISAQYGVGMANLSPLSLTDNEMKNTVIGISVSSLLRGK